MPPPTTRVFHYQHAPVRVRLLDGQPAWFVRDVAAAAGVKLQAGHLDMLLPGIGTADQVWKAVRAAGCPTLDTFRTWLAEVAAQLLTPPQVHAALLVPRRRPAPDQTNAARPDAKVSGVPAWKA